VRENCWCRVSGLGRTDQRHENEPVYIKKAVFLEGRGFRRKERQGAGGVKGGGGRGEGGIDALGKSVISVSPNRPHV